MLQKQYSFLPRFFQLAIASVLSNIMVPLAGLVDLAFLGHLSDIRYLAGVILATILFDYLYRVLKPLRTSTNAITAQAVGRNDAKAIILAGLRSSLIALSIGILVLLLQYPLQKIGFFILSGTPEIEAAGVDYFSARIWGAPAVLLNFVLIGWFLGQEKNTAVLLMSLLGNGLNVVFDYLMIVHWGWGSMGAGLATALSQYSALIIGLVWAGFSINWEYLLESLKEVFDKQALQSILIFNGNILVRFLCLISAYAVFTNVSATLGTPVLAQNGLLLQIALLNQFTVQGVGMTTQTLTGNFKGKGTTELLNPLLQVSIAVSLFISVTLAFGTILFPQTVFGILTNHAEVSENVNQYILWIFPLLSITAVAFMLEGYFIGLKEAGILRNASLIAFFIGFLPFIGLAMYWHSNHFLWSALVSYMTTLMIILATQIPKMIDLHSLATGAAPLRVKHESTKITS
ncbi:MATE family efflux transporter [Aetokthonos hydrillicola Thurmond2011]|jgi:MATE family multidrug resistance protein|uniref:Probable multidrug resistance protein NorM n=1 Tax=Aetokthonos hydrillicola Thurmond2011 TaxID=2712845 RepID=A0AAP5MCR4_9CYAN|nr:guanitoxin biosynthesis MATE family efflux transporter GntT [Aetokthonos hydrillicola]MBO3459721.1 MATE family efflux transporter [Aetokthonos hydrillicola CCALA 1050]MBW4585153.1 MATE family efflux transporter [Aetokthonos hydrillicola CCALA 1050]MDR9899492.1 MATE family efflux transporter [Aetokthonos hydrillicola Thurmond2011]